MKRISLYCTVIAALMVTSVAWSSPGATATPTTLSFTTEADARVESDHPNTNYGSDQELRADGGDTVAESYLRFSVVGLGGNVQRAMLRVYALTDTATSPTLSASGNNWTENGIDWANRPAPTSAPVQGGARLAADTWVDYDVTAFVSRDGLYTFVLATTSTDGVRFSSREGQGPPDLVISTDTATTASSSAVPASPAASPSDPVVVAAGDIACDPTNGAFKGGDGTATSCRQKYTADLVRQINPVAVLGLGDFQYEDGTLAKYRASYDLSWGAFKDITYPTAGPTHDTEGRGDYYAYWGTRAGPNPDQTWYSFDLGAWHIISLNTNCAVDIVGGCKPGSREYEWLKSDLAASSAPCTLAFWHKPRYSSGERHGDDPDADPFWDLLYGAGADLVLSAHDHDYERFAPMDDADRRDDAYGVREFVVGTGGKFLYGFGTIEPNSEVRNNDSFGVLKLTLHPQSYDWEFAPESGKSFSDGGSATCHGAPPAVAATAPNTARGGGMTAKKGGPIRLAPAAALLPEYGVARISQRRRRPGRTVRSSPATL